MTVLKFGRRTICAVCAQCFFEDFVGADTHLCPTCLGEAIDAEFEYLEATAKANGEQTYEEWLAAGEKALGRPAI